MSITLTPIAAKPIKLSKSGSFINWIESHNQTLPEVGKGATEYLWSDRNAYFVNEVSKDYKRVTLERAEPVYRQGDCKYTMEAYPVDYKRTGDIFEVVFRYGGWYKVYVSKLLKDSAIEMIDNAKKNGTWHLLKEIMSNYKGDGDTFFKPHFYNTKKGYSKINIGFGVMNAYYDPSF